mgnify:CR=1 FL=1
MTCESVMEQIMYQRIQAGMIQIIAALRSTVPKKGIVIVADVWASRYSSQKKMGT